MRVRRRAAIDDRGARCPDDHEFKRGGHDVSCRYDHEFENVLRTKADRVASKWLVSRTSGGVESKGG